MSTAGNAPVRYDALESCRGIAALFVAASHLPVNAHLSAIVPVQSDYFVDFFFVLSGFIIAGRYQRPLSEGFGIARFMLLRVGRLYPLHIAVLAAYLALRLLQELAPGLRISAFAAADPWPTVVAANVLMIHSFVDVANWNGPSWSISVEFWTYLLFAAAVVLARRRIVLVLTGLLLIGPVAMAFIVANDADSAMVRCLFGFAAGALTWNLLQGRTFQPGVVIEIVVTAALFVLASTSSRFGAIIVPFVCAAMIACYVGATGAFGRALHHRALVALGTLSYSVYMIHAFIAVLMRGTAHRLERALGTEIFTVIDGVPHLGTNPWLGDAWFLLYLGVVLLVSAITFRRIEQPCRAWFRVKAERMA